MSRDSAFEKAAGYGLDGLGIGVRVSVGIRFSPLRVVQTGSGAHPAYLIRTGGYFPGSNAAGA
jgi:hypothetical protein